MKKYLQIFKNELGTTLEYRSNLLISVLLEIIPVISLVILWNSVYKTNDSLGGFDFSKTLTYYLFIPFVGFVTSVSINLGTMIKDGILSTALLKPYQIWLDVLFAVIANKVSYFFMIFPLYFISTYSIGMYILHKTIKFNNVLQTLIILILVFFMHFLLSIIIEFLAFWYDSTWAFKLFKDIVFSVFGGLAFPIEFLTNGSVKLIFEFLPFKYIYYTPVSYLLGTRSPQTYLLTDIKGILIWSLVFVVCGFFMWKKGIKKYEAFGN